MKVGSLVMLKKHDYSLEYLQRYGNTIPVFEIIYTVRALVDTEEGTNTAIRLEEIINPVMQYSNSIEECCFVIDLFKEIQPPMSVSELVEQCQTVELYATI